MRRMKKRTPASRGTRVIFHAVWVTTVGLIAADVARSDSSLIRDWIQSIQNGTDMFAYVDATQNYGGFADEPSDHQHFGVDMEPSPAPSYDATAASPRIALAGNWTGAAKKDYVRGTLKVDDCDYELRTLNMQIRESRGRVTGEGTYTLYSSTCQTSAPLRTEEAVVTGSYKAPYLKMTIKNKESGVTDMVYYGTARSDGIFGQVRSGFSALLAEHVLLVNH